MAVVYPYVKNPPWADGSGGGTSIDAADLNAIEDGIYNTHLAPAVRAYAAGYSVATSSFTYLDLSAEMFDQAGGAASTQHDNSTNPSRLTCRYAGIYQINGSCVWAANATGIRSLLIQHNHATNIVGQSTTNNGGALTVDLSLSTLYAMAVNDYIELVAWQNSGGSLAINASSSWSPGLQMVRVA